MGAKSRTQMTASGTYQRNTCAGSRVDAAVHRRSTAPASRFRALWRASVAALCGTILTGCVSSQPLPPIYQETNRGRFGPITLLVPDWEPAVKSDIGVHTTGEGVARGMGRGVGFCAEAGANGQEIGALFFLICAPFGALIGAAHGAGTAEQEKSLQRTAASTMGAVHNMFGQQPYADAIRHYGTDNDLQFSDGVKRVAVPAHDTGEGEVSIPAPTGDSFHPMLLAGIRTIEFRRIGPVGKSKEVTQACLKFIVFEQLYRNGATQKQVRQFYAGCNTLAAWGADESARLRDAIQTAYARMARDLIDHLFLVYYPPNLDTKSAEAGEDPIPAWSIHPLNPPHPDWHAIADSTRAMKSFGRVVGRVKRKRDIMPLVRSAHPTLRWQPYLVDPSGAMQFEDLTYDVVIFQGRASAPGKRSQSYYYAGDEVYRRQGIPGTEHRVEQALDPCSVYYWSVRARFRMHGWPRVTAWSGIYQQPGHRTVPWTRRTTSGSITSSLPSYAFPFQTGTIAEGAPCEDDFTQN
jgi:hypothetical protein